MRLSAGAEVTLVGDPSPFRPAWEIRQVAPGIDELMLALVADTPAVPPSVQLRWDEPLIDSAATWAPLAGREKGFPYQWPASVAASSATVGSPVACLVNAAGQNRLCVACSETVHPGRLALGVVEETASAQCICEPFLPGRAAGGRFEVTLRLDRREIRYEQALADVARWWESLPKQTPAPVPDAARRPMYSTWYSFHQRLEPASLEEQCRRARELGCEAVIIDDGWQTLDDRRGYAYCGDWQPVRLPQLGELVGRLHEIGMRVLLWYAPPLVGVRSRAFSRYRDHLLRVEDPLAAGILDPREPEVRTYLTETLERAVIDWNLDGLKLDFLERFASDETDVAEAADSLLAELTARVRSSRPEVLVEFRQPYTGPRMRACANMLRAADCPGDHVRNRFSTIDLRLLSGGTACHSDMLMWHQAEPTESAALQLLAVLFSVPQISVLLDQVPPEHVEMLRFWLSFWHANRDVLLDGELRAASPELNYPVVTARDGRRQVSAVYADAVVRVSDAAVEELHVVNATRVGGVVVDLGPGWDAARLEIRDCRGDAVQDGDVTLRSGVQGLDVPPAGLVSLIREA